MAFDRAALAVFLHTAAWRAGGHRPLADRSAQAGEMVSSVWRNASTGDGHCCILAGTGMERHIFQQERSACLLYTSRCV